ncbi:MAG: hypothetical protein RML56_13030 [Burkholderiales bacterium]|nr:hypothetical protein [Burkholderiales bacterium]
MNVAAQKVRSGWEELVAAGGVESTSARSARNRPRPLGLRPGDRVRHRVHPAGRERREPDRDPRRLLARGAGRLRAFGRTAARPRRARRGALRARSCR